MGEEDLELVRGAIDALHEHDVKRVLETLDPEVELVTAKALFDGTTYHGHDGFRRYMKDMSEDWEQFDYQLDEIREVADGVLLVTGRFSARGRETGNEVEMPGTWLSHIRNGLIVEVHFYADVDSALAAAREHAAH